MKKLALLAVLFGAACSSSKTTSAGSLNGPIALGLAKSATQEGNEVLFVGEADGQDLRVFLPGPRLFVRGPNGISPLSVSLEVVKNNNVVVPSFRPTKIGTGNVGDLGFGVAIGTQNRVALVDAQTLSVSLANNDPVPCAALDNKTPSCLQAQAVDIAVTKGAADDLDTVYLLLGPDAAGNQQIVRFTVIVENGHPVLTNGTDVGAPLTGGVFTGFGVLSNGATAFVADSKAARVLTVSLAGGVGADIVAGGPVRDVFPTPRYFDLAGNEHPEGEFLLAVLIEGKLQVLSPATNGPALLNPNSTDTFQPINLGSAIQDLTFVPCPTKDPANPCRTALQVGSDDTRSLSLLAFATLANGATVALTPDLATVNPPVETTPSVYRQIDVNGSGPSVNAPTFAAPEGVPFIGEQPSLVIDKLVEGVTPDDTFTLKYRGEIPALTNRSGTLASVSATQITLTDATAPFDVFVQAGDLVQLTPLDTSCKGLPDVVFTADATPVAGAPLALSTTGTIPCTPIPPRVAYTVRAAGTEPWVLTGQVTGFVRRFPETTPAAVPVPGPRFYYPATTGGGDAFTLSVTTPIAPPQGSSLKFTTSSGVAAYAVITPDSSSNAAGAGLATSVTANSGTVFIAATGGNAVTVAIIGSLRSSGGITDFR
jgi:hypothetical protein